MSFKASSQSQWLDILFQVFQTAEDIAQWSVVVDLTLELSHGLLLVPCMSQVEWEGDR